MADITDDAPANQQITSTRGKTVCILLVLAFAVLIWSVVLPAIAILYLAGILS